MQTWCYKFDFALSNGSWALVNSPNGGFYDTSLTPDRWRAAQNNPAPNNYLNLNMYRNLGATRTITRIDVDIDQTYIKESSSGNGDAGIIQLRTGTGGGGSILWQSPKENNNCGIEARHIRSYTGLDIDNVTQILIHTEARIANTGCGAVTGGANVYSVTLYGMGENPFGTDNCP